MARSVSIAMKEVSTVGELVEHIGALHPDTRVAFFQPGGGIPLCISAGTVAVGGKWLGIEVVTETITQPKRAVQEEK